MSRRRWQHGGMINSTAPFLEAELVADLQANDITTIISVMVANRAPWYWYCQDRLRNLEVAHRYMHSMGIERGNPIHDMCVAHQIIITDALSRADGQVWN